MAYSNVPIGTSNPGCIVILVDQSWSMSEEWATGTKSEGAALAVNRILEELIIAGRTGDVIRNRCHVTVIGYGERVESIVDGMISQVASSLIEVKKMKKSIPDGALNVPPKSFNTGVMTDLIVSPQSLSTLQMDQLIAPIGRPMPQ